MSRFWRIFGLTVAGSVLGIIGSLLARNSVDFNRFNDQQAALVWIVVAIPLGTLLGSWLATIKRWTFSLGWIMVLYFLSIFVAARLERLIVGEQQAGVSKHSLYFTLIVIVQTVAMLGFAWVLARFESKEQRTKNII